MLQESGDSIRNKRIEYIQKYKLLGFEKQEQKHQKPPSLSKNKQQHQKPPSQSKTKKRNTPVHVLNLAPAHDNYTKVLNLFPNYNNLTEAAKVAGVGYQTLKDNACICELKILMPDKYAELEDWICMQYIERKKPHETDKKVHELQVSDIRTQAVTLLREGGYSIRNKRDQYIQKYKLLGFESKF